MKFKNPYQHTRYTVGKELIMEKIRILLTLITVAIIAGPLIAEAVVYKDNPTGLIIPPEVTDLIGGSNGTGGILEAPITLPQIVESEYDPISRTVRFSFSFTNPFGFDLTLRALSADVVCTEHNFLLGKAVLVNSVQLRGGETVLIPVIGTWTEAAIEHFTSAHAGEQKISVDLTGITTDISGISIDLTERIHVGEIPLT